MARVLISNVRPSSTKSISTKDKLRLSLSESDFKTIITESSNNLKEVSTKNYPIFQAENNKRLYRLEEVLPFRVRITNIGVQGYSPVNPAPIGIAVIGLNNYIL